MSTNTVAVEINGQTWEAAVTDGQVDIACDGHWATSGKWTGSAIEDAPAPLGDDVYAAIESALREAGVPA